MDKTEIMVIKGCIRSLSTPMDAVQDEDEGGQ